MMVQPPLMLALEPRWVTPPSFSPGLLPPPAPAPPLPLSPTWGFLAVTVRFPVQLLLTVLTDYVPTNEPIMAQVLVVH